MPVDFSWLAHMGLLLAVGFAAGKAKIIGEAGRSSLAVILFHIAYPALLIQSITQLDLRELAGESLRVAAVTLCATLILYGAGIFAVKRVKSEPRRPIILFTMGVGNVTFAALPVIAHFFGETGVYYTVLHGTAQDLLIWTLYYAYFTRAGRRFSLKKLLNPTTTAFALAIALAMLHIKPSGAFERLLTALGQMTIPIALIYVGATLAANRLQDWKPDRQVLLVSAVKVLVVPSVFFCAALLLPMSPALRAMMTVMFASPAAVMLTVWTKQYGYDELFSIKLLVVSTLLFFLVIAGAFSITLLRS